MSRKLLRSTALVSAVIAISRISGFARDIVYAYIFGAGTEADIFFVVFRIPNFLRRLFAEGAFSQAFVPVFSEYHTLYSHYELKKLCNYVTGTLTFILILVSLGGILLSPIIIIIFAPGFIDDFGKYQLSVEMLRITFPYLLFISLTALSGGIMNSCGKFIVPAITSVILNITMIIAAVWLVPHMQVPVLGLAWGVLIAGIIQLLFQIPFLCHIKLMPKPSWGWQYCGVQKILKLMIPAIFGSSISQINLLVDTVIASFLVSGSVSWLYYSDRLVEFPLGIFGTALGTVILPKLSHQHVSAEYIAFSKTLDWALRWTLLIGMPATISLIILSKPILSSLFQYGHFNTNDVMMSARSLVGFALGLVAFMLIKVLAPGFYARQDTTSPVKYGLIAMGVNTIVMFILIWPLAHASLALATSLGAYVNASLLFIDLRKSGIYTPCAGWSKFLLQLLIANFIMGLILWFSTGDINNWVNASTISRLLHLAILVIIGAMSYFLAILAVGIRPKRSLLAVE